MKSIKMCALIAAAFSIASWTTLSSASGAISLDVKKDSEISIHSLIPPLLPPPSNPDSMKFVYIVQVEDDLGRVVFLEYQNGEVQSIVQVFSIIWRPDSEGTYTVKSHVWSDLEHPEPRDFLVREFRIDADEETKAICSGSALCFTGIVTEIIDGDTLDVGDIRIRLALVDTPERDEAGYSEASDFTSELCPVGSQVVVDQDDGQLIDDFGRMLAKITCEGNKVLNAELLESGHAQVLREYCNESEYSTESWIVSECTGEETPPVEKYPIQETPVEVQPDDEPDCDPSYPDVCIPSPPPDLDCGDISYRNFRVVGSDPHRFDGNKDGVGCES
ncbi:MAG: thermonuclease family protein [Nitrososphaera sp.]